MDAAAIATFAAVGVASPVLAWLAGILIQGQKVRRAHVRLRDEPEVFPGATFSRVYTDAGAPLMEAGRVASLERGRIVLASADGKRRITLTSLEFEAMHPVWTSTDEQIAAGSEAGQF